MAKVRANGSVDSTLGNAVSSAMGTYTDNTNIRVADIVMAYGGDTKRLAQDLAEIKGTKVASQERNIHRWLATESGKEVKHKRSVSKASLNELKGLFVKKNPPKRVVIDVTGDWVDPSGNVHHSKRIATDLGQGDPDVQAILDALQSGDDMGAWNAALDGYVPGSYFQSISSISVTFD